MLIRSLCRLQYVLYGSPASFSQTLLLCLSLSVVAVSCFVAADTPFLQPCYFAVSLLYSLAVLLTQVESRYCSADGIGSCDESAGDESAAATEVAAVTEVTAIKD